MNSSNNLQVSITDDGVIISDGCGLLYVNEEDARWIAESILEQVAPCASEEDHICLMHPDLSGHCLICHKKL